MNSLLDSMNQEVQVGDSLSRADDVADQEIVIADKEDVARQVNDENVQAQGYERSVPTYAYSNTSESYFPYIPRESLLGVQEFKQMQQEFQVNQVVGSHVESLLPSLFFEKILYILYWHGS